MRFEQRFCLRFRCAPSWCILRQMTRFSHQERVKFETKERRPRLGISGARAATTFQGFCFRGGREIRIALLLMCVIIAKRRISLAKRNI